ncbi:MAG TPA: hypothetical protein VEA44_16665 [Caulobacter sp.]|nr:hypothetical protein [Caulobacter sp.]
MALSETAQTLAFVAPTLASVSLAVHIAGGSLGIVSGYTAVAVRKGAAVHRIAGTVFVAAMLTMAGFATGIALSKGQSVNTFAGLSTLYLVVTAWLTVKRPQAAVGRLEPVLAVAAAVIAALALAEGARGGNDSVGVPRLAAAIFGVVVALGLACDLKVLRQRGVAGPGRISRHLWRMCTAMFVATGSFFFGQADVIPAGLRGPHLAVLGLAPLVLLLFWLIRVRIGRPRLPAQAQA